jgi:hypothetical protein
LLFLIPTNNFNLGAGLCTTVGSDSFGKQAAIPRGSTVDFYANPAILYFTVTLTAFSMSCKPVNSGDWVKKLLKNKNKVHFLDIDLEFGGGKYFASLRLSRGYRGILEVVMHLFITKCAIYLAYILVARACVANKMSSHSQSLIQ